MNLYLLTQIKKRGYDTYDSSVVVAKSARDARKIHPSIFRNGIWDNDGYSWPSDPADVQTELIGKTTHKALRGVICASFNAG